MRPAVPETEKRINCRKLTIASVKENEMKPITIDAMLTEGSAMAFVGHQVMRDNVGLAKRGSGRMRRESKQEPEV